MSSLLPPGPTVSCFDDLDFFNDFENEFPAIVYNNAQTSKSNLLTELILNPQHIDEFDDETSFSEYNEEERNVLYFNNLFPFNIIYPNDSKSDKDNDDDKIDINQSSRDVIQSLFSAKSIRWIRLTNTAYSTQDLTEKKTTTLVKYLRSGNFKVLVS
ncbi:hypothetical protein Tco_0398031 [Tanacetum coccineum]